MWIYIMASRYRGTMYVGVTNCLSRRMGEHISGDGSRFVQKYDVTRLVYAEQMPTAEEAIAQEKRVKKWARAWKFQLIEKGNPDWQDLSGTIHLD